ncbi:MAG: CheR family methyltransferase [Candidatus Xenobia bacterium]
MSDHLLRSPDFASLKAWVIDATGLAFYEARDAELARCVAQRMQAIKRAEVTDYLRLLQHPERGPAELDLLVAELTNGETYFFRYPEQFTALREVILPDVLLRNRPIRRLRIWSAGCAIGAEPYSLSILLRRELPGRLVDWDVSITGTDINRRFLALAQAGSYGEWALRGVGPELRGACFEVQGERWVIGPEYRAGVRFQYHNLVRFPYPAALTGFDVILCRNVFLYFSLPTVRQILAQFQRCLVPGGWLLVGHAESNLELFRSFRTVGVPGATVYQNAAAEPAAAWAPPAGPEWYPEEILPPAAEAPPAAPPPLWPEWHPAETLPPAAEAPPATPPHDLHHLMNCGDWVGALHACQQALAVDRLDPVLHYHLALIREQRGDDAGAEQSLRRALYLDRQFALAHFHLGRLLQRRGDRAAAGRAFQNARRLLEKLPAGQTVNDADGLTAGSLKELTRLHLEHL